MTRTVNGELLFKDREKEVLRKMIRQVTDFCGVEVLTYCIMSNHFRKLKGPVPKIKIDWV
ncbi:MAG: REP element-mobilizing transposase RayT [Lentimonas sp.]|jgi:putative transposase